METTPQPNMTPVALICPASPAQLTEERLQHMAEELHWQISYFPREHIEPTLAYDQAPILARQLSHVLHEAKYQCIVCLRGGYGASDLLNLLPWDKLSELELNKWFVGFSDISALTSAFYSRLGWNSIHGPMPSTGYWLEQSSTREIEKSAGKPYPIADIDTLHEIICGSRKTVSLNLFASSSSKRIEGQLFGGCLSVLTSLLGTPYFPSDLNNHILFLEDIGENHGQIIRNWNQLLLSGVLEQVEAVVLGHFAELDIKQSELWECLKQRSTVPLFQSKEFGHQIPNIPLIIGAKAIIENRTLEYTVPKKYAATLDNT